MKRRYLYLLLFALPGLFISAIIAFAAFGAAAGMLWLFVFGDNPWPASCESLPAILFLLCFLVLWTASGVAGYIVGKRREKDPATNRRHILASLAVTFGSVLLIVMYQVRVGNIGPKPDSIICADFCATKGFPASSMPPRSSGQRTCGCLDAFGRPVVTISIERIDFP